MKLAFTVATPDTSDTGMLALRGELEENLRCLAELGYDAAELMVRDPAALPVGRIKRLSNELGLAIPAVSTGQLRKEDGLSLGDLNTAAREKAVARTRSVIEFAAEFGAQVNIGTLRGQLPAGNQAAAARSAALDSIIALAEYGEKCGVRLAIEPQCRSVINWLNSVDETLAFFESSGAVKLSMVFDIYHASLEENSLPASIVRAWPSISWVQVSDSNRMPPGAGHWYFGDAIRVLEALGYDGYLSIECLPHPDGYTAAARSIAHLQAYIGEGSSVFRQKEQTR